MISQVSFPLKYADKRCFSGAVWKNSSYYQRIKYLEQEIGEPIEIQALDGNYSPEKLLTK